MPHRAWRSDLYGAALRYRQVFAVMFDPTNAHSHAGAHLRPARETCEACRLPQKYGEDRLRVIDKFGDDETNSPTKTVLLMKIGGGNHGIGIHGTHLGPGVVIRYGIPIRSARPSPGSSTTRRRASRVSRGGRGPGWQRLDHPRRWIASTATTGRRTVISCPSARSMRPWPRAICPPPCRCAQEGRGTLKAAICQPGRRGGADPESPGGLLPRELSRYLSRNARRKS